MYYSNPVTPILFGDIVVSLEMRKMTLVVGFRAGVPKFLTGGINIRGAAFDYNTGCWPYSIHCTN